MSRFRLTLALLIAGFAAWAKPVCVGGVCYPDEETARAAGVVLPGAPAVRTASDAPRAVSDTSGSDRRLAMGYMSTSDFVAFLKNEPATAGLGDHALTVVFLLVLLGGLAANLTPCVLPLVPVNLILIGKGWKRGAAYAAGIATAYGALGLAAAFGGLAFGTLQASPFFNLAVAVVFVLLALAMFGTFTLPAFRLHLFDRKPARISSGGQNVSSPFVFKPYLLGLGSATLASACVEPILLATLLLTAKWFAAGRLWAVCLPFVLGAGMGLPYPLAAAGFSVLPRPGAWMVWVKRAFAAVFLVMAAWYGRQAVTGFRASDGDPASPGTALTAGSEIIVRDPQRPTLVAIGAPWCRNCAAMRKTTLREKAVRDVLTDFKVWFLEIQSFDELARQPELKNLAIKGLPAYVILPPVP